MWSIFERPVSARAHYFRRSISRESNIKSFNYQRGARVNSHPKSGQLAHLLVCEIRVAQSRHNNKCAKLGFMSRERADENAIWAKANDLCFAPWALSVMQAPLRFISLLFFASEPNLHSLIPSEMLMAGRLFLFLSRSLAPRKFLRRQIKLVNFHFCSHARDFDLPCSDTHARESIKREKKYLVPERRGNYFSRVMCARGT